MEALIINFVFGLLILQQALFCPCWSNCSGGHVYQVYNVVPSNDSLALNQATQGLTSKVQCIEWCNRVPDCLSMFYNETSGDCYLNDHTTFKSSNVSGFTGLTYIGWKTRCDDTGMCTSLKTCDGVFATDRVYKNCSDAILSTGKCQEGYAGLHYIDPDGAGPLAVECRYKVNYTWTVIQKRINNGTNFYRGWNEYRNGFGIPIGNYWLGLEAMFRITATAPHRLRIAMNGSVEARYDPVRVSNESNYYKLELGPYIGGTALDSLGKSANGSYFSTFDADHDNFSNINCASTYHGGWWYGGTTCLKANLNGLYRYSCNDTPGDCMVWETWKGLGTGLYPTTIMFGLPLAPCTP